MESDEYFLAGKMYVFGGFDTYTDEILLKKFGKSLDVSYGLKAKMKNVIHLN